MRLFCTYKEDKILAGVTVFEHRTMAHVQYISASEKGKELGALDLLFDTLINYYKEVGKEYFEFGISSENGTFLNHGLISQKEGFGGRTVMYNQYFIDFEQYDSSILKNIYTRGK